MKKIIPLLFFLFTGILAAQVGINTPAPDAQLDIRSANQAAPTNQDGLLIPKVDLFPAINPTVAQNGMLVFLTTLAGANPPGFYYWDNPTTSWKGIATDNTKWGLAGNAGTNASSFIGTTDVQNVIFKRNNIRSGIINNLNTAFGFNSYQTLSGAHNSAFGVSALRSFFGGNDNTAMGYEALDAFQAGSGNVAVGAFALADTRDGQLNTAIGHRALNLLSGHISCTDNVALGANAGSNITFGFGNIMIGSGANSAATSMYRLNIGNIIYGSMIDHKSVGINTSGPQAMLDVKSSNSGVLIPRIALTAANISAPVIDPALAPSPLLPESTLIYNTATAGTAPNNVIPGFYYWSGAKWLRIDADEAKNKWGLTGNSGTNAATHFIGTTDNADVVFRKNNTPAGRLNYSVTAFGVNALANGTPGNCAAFGSGALQSSTGMNNTAIGNSAMNENSVGSGNTAVGRLALYMNLAGNDNAAVGEMALAHVKGNENAGIGSYADIMEDHSQSTVLGAQTFIDANNATAVGYRAMARNDNTLVLGSVNGQNGATASVNVGIGTTTPARTLHVINNGSSVTQGQLYLQQAGTGDVLMHYGISNGRHFNMGIDATDSAFKIGTSATAATASSIGTLLTIMPAGEVGIGTAAPQSKLEIVDENVTTTATTRGNLHVMSNNAQNVNLGAAITLGGYRDAAQSAMRVFGSIEGRKSNATESNSNGYLMFKTDNAGNLLERMRITHTGDVGIGTITPAGQLQLSLDEALKPGSATWTIASDERLKTIHGSYAKGLDEIGQLKTIRYHYKNIGERTFEQEVLDREYAGFSAQQVQKIFPEAIGTDPDGYLNFNMHPILVASVNAIRELKEQNEALTKEYQKLQLKLEQQDSKLQEILNRLPPEGR